MSGIRLREALETKSLRSARIIAGRGDLDRIVTGVTVGEVPDIANWLTGGELVLSTFFVASRSRDSISSFAKKIINSPASALAVKTTRFMEVLPPEILELADELQFPIIEVQSDIRWTTIIADIYEAMARMGSTLATGETGNELLQAAIDGRGLKSIALTTSRKLDAPVVIYDLLDGLIVEETPTDPFPTGLIDLLGTKARPGGLEEPRCISGSPVINRFTEGGNFLFTANVTIGLEVVAFVATVMPDNLDEASLSILKRAAEATAIEIARARAIEEAKARIYGDFLRDLISGRIPKEQIDSQVVKLGGDFSKGYTVLYCLLKPNEKFGRFYREVSRAFRSEAQGSLLMEHEEGLVAMLAQTGEVAKINQAGFARYAAKRILAIADLVDIKTTVGISRFRSDTTEIVRALDEAKIALDSGYRLNGEGSITDFDEVGVYRLLLPLTRDARSDGQLYYEETAGKLVEYDKAHGTDLVETLESFRRNSENIALSAEELYTHRHTIRYRLQRIAEITGCNPFNGIDREKLYMGLHIKHLLNL